MDHQRSIPTETVDQLLSPLANSRCRDAITCMRAESAEVFSISDLASELSTGSDGEPDRVVIQSHHSILPRLADADVVTHDPESNTVQYRGAFRIEIPAGLPPNREPTDGCGVLTDSPAW
ncbi:DUF7344 domain-containing protein [Halorarum halophilum]